MQLTKFIAFVALVITMSSCTTFVHGKNEKFIQVKDGIKYECRPVNANIVDKFDQDDDMKGPHKGKDEEDGMRGPHKGKDDKRGPHKGKDEEDGMRGPKKGKDGEDDMRGPHQDQDKIDDMKGPHKGKDGMRGPHKGKDDKRGPHKGKDEEDGMRGPNKGKDGEDGMKGPHKGKDEEDGTTKPNYNDEAKEIQFPWSDLDLDVCFSDSDTTCSGKCTTRSKCSSHLSWNRKACGKSKKCGCCSNPLNDEDSKPSTKPGKKCIAKSKFCEKMGGECEDSKVSCSGKWLPSFCKGKSCGCCIPEKPIEDKPDDDEELSDWGCAPADYTACVNAASEDTCISQEDYTGDLVCAWNDGSCVGCNSFHGDEGLCNSQSNCAYRDHDNTCGTINDSSLSSPDYDSEGEPCN